MSYNNAQDLIDRGMTLSRKKKMTLTEVAFTCQRPISSEEKTFEERSRSIMSGVSAYFGKGVKTDGFWKISINVNSENQIQHLKTVGGVLRYNINFNIPEFLSLGIDAQKTQMLTLVYKTLNKIFSEYSLDSEKLNGLVSFIEQRKFESRFSGPVSRRKEIAAFALCEQRFDQAEIFVVLKKGNKEIKRFLLLSTSPEEFIFNIYLNEVKCISDNKLELIASNGEVFQLVFDDEGNRKKGQKVCRAR